MTGCGCGLAGVVGIALVFLAIVFDVSMAHRNPAWNRDDFAGCEARLLYLCHALESSQKDHPRQWPTRLEDLYPDYLPSREYLHCPREGQPGASPFIYTPATAKAPTDPLVVCINHGQGKIILQCNLKLRSPSWGDRKRKGKISDK